MYKLTIGEVRTIKGMLKRKRFDTTKGWTPLYTITEIAKLFEVSRTAIYMIEQGRSYADIEGYTVLILKPLNFRKQNIMDLSEVEGEEEEEEETLPLFDIPPDEDNFNCG